MSKIIAIKEDCELFSKILSLEAKMDELGLKIIGDHLQLVVGDTIYNIGRDQDSFPRSVDEPFWKFM